MSAVALEIDNSMYKLYVGDAAVHIHVLTEILSPDSPDQIDADSLNIAIKAAQSISSGATLCNIPRISQITESITTILRQLVSNKIQFDRQLHTGLGTAIGLLEDLNKTEASEVSNWFSNNDEQISSIIAELSSMSSSENVSSSTPTSGDEKQPAAANSCSNIDPVMLDLFKLEAEAQSRTINEHLLELESDPDNSSLIEPLMRASHSIKGAARMIGFEEIVSISHRMEDCFVHTQKGMISLDKKAIDLLLSCNDIIDNITLLDNQQLPAWLDTNRDAFDHCLQLLESLSNDKDFNIDKLGDITKKGDDQKHSHNNDDNSKPPGKPETQANARQADNTVRILPERLNKMLAVSNELLVSQHWIQGHLGSLQQLKKRQTELAASMMKLRQQLEEFDLSDEIYNTLQDAENRVETCRQALHHDINQLDEYDRKSFVLSSRLNHEVIASRMRSFADGTHGFKRMVRDVSQSLGKEVTLSLEGLDTLVDSDILDKIEAPLTHLLRNAIDHGIEGPAIRIQKGKQAQGHITISAFHSAGRLNITITDDGKGVDLEKLKSGIISKGMVNQQMADKLTETELLEFLFLPGFSTREDVTEYSGRGVGLDVVHSVVTGMRGQIKSNSRLDQGLTIQLQLPLTLSLLHSLLADIGNEYYAFPLTRVHTVIKKNAGDIFTLENKQLIKHEGQDISLINGRQVLDCRGAVENNNDVMEIIIIGERGEYYAIVVDGIVGEANLALQPIDHRLGKIRDISAAAIADDGRPVLVIDIDDLLVNLQELIGINELGKLDRNIHESRDVELKKVLVIDDSLTVREVEKNLLQSRGYHVVVAIDGIDGWNTVRQQEFDLVITDIDMPRMNGIELVGMLKNDARLSTIPVMIVSYKDNPEDRKKGLEAGADYYLTKGSFHDEGLINGVIDLIGEPAE